VNGDGVTDLLVAAGNGGGPRVALYDGASLGTGQQVKLVNDFFAFDPSLRNGVYVSAGDLNGDGVCDLIFGAGSGGGPRVEALDGHAFLGGRSSVLANFFAGSTDSRQGVDVGTLPGAGGRASIVATDLETHTAGVYGPDGGMEKSITGNAGGVSFSTGKADTVSSDTAAALIGTYTGSGSGTLIAFPASSGAPTTSSATAAVTLDITNATVDPPPPGSTSSHGITITATLTVAVDGRPTVTMPVSGQFRLTSSTAVAGVFDLGEFQGGLGPTAQAPNQGVFLHASLSDGAITLNQLSVFSYARSAGGFAYHSPTGRNGTPITLTQPAQS
jgi:hypothetical protein